MGKDTPRRNPREYFYAEILQLPPGTRRPDHYTLLGLHYFEADHDTILRAALTRIRLLETCEVDPRPAYRKMAMTLVGELREAQMTLLDPQRRRVYDATLIGNDDDGKEEEEDKEAELGPGAMIQDRYRVMREVRQGGFGVVYEAMDKNLRSRVHLSVLRPRLSRERRHRRRIENATRAAAGFEHPNVVRLDEVGETDGLLFTRSRAFEGKSLLELIEATPHRRFEVDEARRIGARVAEALQAAHEQNVVHGDLRPHNVFLDGEGRVLICDFVISRAVADESDSGRTRYREPENEPSQAGDAFALGCLLQQMLTGEPPHDEPRPLPDEVPATIGTTVAHLLDAEPGERPAPADVAQTLTASGAPQRNRLWVGAAALLLVVAVAGFLGWGGGDDDKPGDTVREVAWKLIAQNRFSDAIEKLEQARAQDPDDDTLVAPLASAYERAADERAKANDPWAAQTLLAKAVSLEPTPARESAHAAAKHKATQRLDAVAVAAPACTETPSIRFEAGDVPIVSVTFTPEAKWGTDDPLHFRPKLDEGAHEIAWTLEDKAGNKRQGVSKIIVDRTAPVVKIASPEEGAFLRKGLIPVVVEVTDANPAATVKVRGRSVELRDGKAVDTFQFGDGEHLIDVVATDRAGHTVRAERKIIVDSKAPELTLAATRIVTRGGRVTIRGTAGGRAKAVTVDGRSVKTDDAGAFSADVDASADRQVSVEATSPTGLVRRQSVDIVVDRDRPEIKAEWVRRDSKGVLLYGVREMDAGGVRVPLVVKDRTQVSFKAGEGTVASGVWTLAPHQGKRKVRVVARDEAGNETALELVVEGHRAKPRLVVTCNVEQYTRDDEVLIEVDADAEVEVLGRPREPGRIKLPLEEGRRELVVRAVDRYGNESRWSKVVVVDRTPPEVKLVGEVHRGIGKQELEFEANEPIATLTCFAKTWKVNGTRALVTADLKAGRKNITVRAKDLAGNAAKTTLPLRVQNRVLLLDGKSGVLVRLPKDLSPPSRFTVECWVRGAAPQGTTAVFSNYNRSGLAVMWSSSQSRVPYAVWYAENSGRLALSVKKTWKWEEWVHVALCYDGKRMRFYVDGSLQGSMELKEIVKLSGEPLYVGSDTGARYGFRGAIDELRVSKVCRYTRGFSPQKFLKADDDTLALLRFDTRVNKVIPDASGNKRNGTPFGNAKLVDDSR